MGKSSRLKKIKTESDILIQTMRIYTQYIGMELGIEKRAILLKKRGKRYLVEEMKQTNLKNQNIRRKAKSQEFWNTGSRHRLTRRDESMSDEG